MRRPRDGGGGGQALPLAVAVAAAVRAAARDAARPGVSAEARDAAGVRTPG